MAIEKLKALHLFFTAQNLIDENLISSWAEDATATAEARINGNGIDVCRFEYTGVLSLDGFSGDENLLLALLTTWLMTNDPERGDNLPAPEVHLDIRDDQLADVDLSIRFEETVTITPDPNGLISFNGEMWSLIPAVITVAESGAVNDSEVREHDAEFFATN